MVNVNLKRSEDTIIALNFHPRNLKMKIVKKALANFFNEKTAQDSSDRYNLVLFRGNPSYLEDFTFKREYLLSLIDESESEINTIAVENVIFMSLTFLIEVFKVVGNKFFRIIIITDQDMKPVEREFMVEDLLGMTKDMPVFIDILRVNVKEDKDPEREKLQTIINWSQGGELIYVPKPKQLDAVLQSLVDKKYNESDVFEDVKEIKIEDKHASFYENISQFLVPSGENGVKCMACFKDGEIFDCPSCGNAKMHKSCWAFWSKSSHIGVRHIFRCPICFALLQLERSFIEEVLGEEEEEIQETIQQIEVADQDELLKAKDEEAPKLIEALLDQF